MPLSISRRQKDNLFTFFLTQFWEEVQARIFHSVFLFRQ